MISTETPTDVIHIGVFAAREGWLLTHPNVQSRFEDLEEAMAAARRLAHLESWRGHAVDVLVQDRFSSEVASVDLQE
jgi:hypothetical protein